MSNREKLIKLMFSAANYADEICVGKPCAECYLGAESRDCTTLAIADHLISNGVTVQKWIPVSERLPETASEGGWGNYTYQKSVRVLCACVQDSGKRMVKEGYCEYWNEGKKISWKIPGTIDSVTHWMPLPEPPKECE